MYLEKALLEFHFAEYIQVIAEISPYKPSHFRNTGKTKTRYREIKIKSVNRSYFQVICITNISTLIT